MRVDAFSFSEPHFPSVNGVVICIWSEEGDICFNLWPCHARSIVKHHSCSRSNGDLGVPHNSCQTLAKDTCFVFFIIKHLILSQSPLIQHSFDYSCSQEPYISCVFQRYIGNLQTTGLKVTPIHITPVFQDLIFISKLPVGGPVIFIHNRSGRGHRLCIGPGAGLNLNCL